MIRGDRADEGVDEIVDVHDLDRRALPAHPWPPPAGEQARPQVLGAGAEDGRGAQHRDHRVGVVDAPLVQQALDLGGVHGRPEPRIRTQRRVLGERHRIRRPRAVDRRGRDPDDAAHAHRAGRVEHASGAVHVDPRHQRVVHDRIGDGGEVHHGVAPAQERIELAAGDVDEVVLVAADGPDRFAHVETDDPRDAGGRERGHESAADEAGRAGDGDRAGDGGGRHESP